MGRPSVPRLPSVMPVTWIQAWGSRRSRSGSRPAAVSVSARAWVRRSMAWALMSLRQTAGALTRIR